MRPPASSLTLQDHTPPTSTWQSKTPHGRMRLSCRRCTSLASPSRSTLTGAASGPWEALSLVAPQATMLTIQSRLVRLERLVKNGQWHVSISLHLEFEAFLPWLLSKLVSVWPTPFCTRTSSGFFLNKVPLHHPVHLHRSQPFPQEADYLPSRIQGLSRLSPQLHLQMLFRQLQP